MVRAVPWSGFFSTRARDCWAAGWASEAQDGGCRKGPCRSQPIADGGAGRALTCHRRYALPPDVSLGGTEAPPSCPLGKRSIWWMCIEPLAAEHLANPGHGLPQVDQGLVVMVCGGCDESECHVAQPRGLGGDERQIDCVLLCAPCGTAQRSAPPSRVALEALVLPLAGRVYGLLVWWTCARSAASCDGRTYGRGRGGTVR